MVADVNSTSDDTAGTPAPLQLFVHGLQVYYLPVIALIGLCGNAVCCVVFTKAPFRKLSSVQYLHAIVAVDSIILAIRLCDWLAEVHLGLHGVSSWCQCRELLLGGAKFLSRWYLLCFTVDRYLAVVTLKTRSALMAKVVVVAFATLAVVVFLNISLTVGVRHVVAATTTRAVCIPLAQFAALHRELQKFDVSLNVVIPLFSSIVIFFMIVSRYYQMRTAAATPASERDSISAELCRNTNQTIVLLFIFLAGSLPIECFYSTHVFLKHVYSIGHFQTSLNYFLWKKTLYCVKLTRQSLNVVTLVLIYPEFRKSVTSLLCCFHRTMTTSGMTDLALPLYSEDGTPAELRDESYSDDSARKHATTCSHVTSFDNA